MSSSQRIKLWPFLLIVSLIQCRITWEDSLKWRIAVRSQELSSSALTIDVTWQLQASAALASLLWWSTTWTWEKWVLSPPSFFLSVYSTKATETKPGREWSQKIKKLRHISSEYLEMRNCYNKAEWNLISHRGEPTANTYACLTCQNYLVLVQEKNVLVLRVF